MDFKHFSCLTIIFLINITGVCSLTLVSSTNPLAVGTNVTLNINPLTAINIGAWMFNTTLLVMWYPAGYAISSAYEGRVSFDRPTLQITLHLAKVEDSGLYVLQGLDPSVKADLTLSVLEPISNVTIAVSNRDLVEFSNVVMSCSAQGNLVNFTWYKGSSALTTGGRFQLSKNGSDLTITNVTRYDRGPFTCFATNPISNGTSAPLYLNISYGPSNLSITVQPEKMAYISGSNVMLNCSADSNPPASFQWSHNSISLNKQGQILQLTNATSNQTGVYTCTAYNPVTLTNASVKYNIKIIDPLLSAEVVATGVPIVNMPFNLSCDIMGPVDTVSWIKDGVTMNPINGITLFNQNKTLTFSQLSLFNEGAYQCFASNAVSNKTNEPFNLKINYGPLNVTVSGPSMGEVGSKVILNCNASSRPSSNYRWYFNGSKVAEGPAYETGSLSLNDSGEYKCIAQNNITGGNNSATWNLTVVVGISSVVVTQSKPNPLAAKDLQLFCNVTGNYDSIRWLKNNQTLTGTNRVSVDNTTVTFQPLMPSDEGEYRCVATNMFGEHFSHGSKLSPVYGPVNITITVEKGIIIVLTCAAQSYPPSEYHWIINNITDFDGMGPTIEFPQFTPPGTSYTCMAKNPETNYTLSKTYIVPDDNAATPLRIGALPTFLAVVLYGWFLWL